MQNIQNIIFDLGGIFLNIDFKQTELAFAELGVGNFNEYYTLQSVSPLFGELEIGAVTPEVFYDEFRKLSKTSLTNDQIKYAWNALLIGFPKERIEWLERIGKRYKIYLLSNTNQIHYEFFTNTFKSEFNKNLNDFFIKAYYSHRLGLRKPSKEIFERVLKDENLNAAETIFIDDSEANIHAATSVGLKTIYLPSPKTVLELQL